MVPAAAPVAAFFIGTAMNAHAAPGTHSLQGVVTVSPVCGGAQREGPECSAPLTDTVVQLVGAGGQVVAQARTDAQGRFELTAALGGYQVRLQVPKVMRCAPVDVTLPRLASAGPLILRCDSGMR